MKILLISDTHRRHEELELEEADMIIHCGDYSSAEMSFFYFLKWFNELDYKYKIFISGNHDQKAAKLGADKIKKLSSLFGDAIYLEDESIEIEGFKIYGSPWTPSFGPWEFMKGETGLKPIWEKIPSDTQILITHGPQHGVLDKVKDFGKYKHVGSRTLSNKMAELKEIKYHFFGHIHGETGVIEADEFKNYVSINASSLYEYYQNTENVKPPILINI